MNDDDYGFEFTSDIDYDEISDDSRYSDPRDVTPADDVWRDGDEIVIDHGSGLSTRMPAEVFYGDREEDTKPEALEN